MTEKIPLKKALLSILLSVICINGFALFVLFPDLFRETKAAQIGCIAQVSSSQDRLKTAHLAQLLELNKDQKLSSFDTVKAEEKLMSFPFIKKALIAKIEPNTLFIDYTLREPIAYVANWSNAAIDEEGVLFPFTPYFTPKNIPKVYFGENQSSFSELKMIIDLFSQIPGSYLDLIDLSKIEAESLGKQEIDLRLFQWQGHSKIEIYLRLPIRNWAKSIKSYRKLIEKKLIFSKNSPIIIDLRLQNIAIEKSYGSAH